VPVIDINAIGAGGGSIAWIDEGGALRVGPQSAEAVPGPACYRRGGERPTVTDAALVLGRLGNETRLGGEMTLDGEAARRVIETDIAKPLGITVEEAAAGILRVANSNIVRGIRVVSVERGYDPRAFALVPFGGAGPMHGTPVARELSIGKILVPPTPGILCALGMLVSDLRHDLVETHIGALANFPYERASEIIGRLQARGRELLEEDRVPPGKQRIEVAVQVRYLGQSYELSIPLKANDIGAWQAVAAAFHEAHHTRYGHADPTVPVEIVGFAVTAIGLIDTPRLPTCPEGGAEPSPDALLGRRRIFFESDQPEKAGWQEAQIVARDKLLAGNRIEGPAVIEEVSATTVLYPGDVATVLPSGSVLVEVGI
jgi:N-methylhydantoinase A